MRPSECPVVERRVDIPIKCRELELLKSCVEHTAVVVINRLQQEQNDGSHLEQQETWLQPLPVSPHATPTKCHPQNNEMQLYSPKQLRQHSPNTTQSHFSSLSQTQSPRQSYSQSARQSPVPSPRHSFPLSPRQAHSQSPRHLHPQSPRQSFTQSLSQLPHVSPKQPQPQSQIGSHPPSPSQSHPASPRQSYPPSPRHSQPLSSSESHQQSSRHPQPQSSSKSHLQVPNQTQSLSPRQLHLLSPSQSHPQSPRQSNSSSPKQSHPRTLWYSRPESPRASHLHVPKELRPQLLRQPQFSPQKQPQQLKEGHSFKELWPDWRKQPQHQLQKQLVVNVEKLPEESPKCELQERQHSPSLNQQQNSFQKELYVQLEKLAGEPLEEMKHQESLSPHRQLHVQIEKLPEQPNWRQSPTKQPEGLLLSQLHVKLEKLSEDSRKLDQLHHHLQGSTSLNHTQPMTPKKLCIQLQKLPGSEQNWEVKPPQPPVPSRLQDQPARHCSRYTIPEPEPVVTRRRGHQRQLLEAQQRWSAPALQPRVLVQRLTPEDLARTLEVRIVLHRLSSKVLKKYGIQPPVNWNAVQVQKPAIDIDDEDWFDLHRQEWTLCSILQARERAVLALWRAANAPRKPKKKFYGVNGFIRKPARINKIKFMSKLGLKRRPA